MRHLILAALLLMPVALDTASKWGGWPMPTCFPCDDEKKKGGQ
jgi:hypothetical protein